MKIVRIIAIVLLAGLFSTLAFFLYQKQTQRFTFRSFELPNQTNSIFIPNLDRLLSRMDDPSQFAELTSNPILADGFSKLLNEKKNAFNAVVGPTCFLSFSESDFSIVFKNQDLTSDGLVQQLKTLFGAEASVSEEVLSLNNSKYFLKQYGFFTHISSVDYLPRYVDYQEPKTNADYVVFQDSVRFTRKIIAYHQLYSVSNDTGAVVKGSPIKHAPLVTKIPSHFEELTFYGSDRFTADKFAFFNSPSDEAYSWVNGGLLVFKKGDYELLIASQNDQRDLKLMLEEQTLASKIDTLPIAHTTVKNFEIMPFQSTFNWTNEIPALSQKMSHYTEFENINVMGSSLEAIQWYLAEIQTGNLIYQDEALMTYYLRSTPLKAHMLKVQFDGDSLQSESFTWLDKEKIIVAKTAVSIHGSAPQTVAAGMEIDVPFEPIYILPLNKRGDGELLIASESQMALIKKDGSIAWRVNVSSPLLFAPQFIDLENDGKIEFALFSQQGFTVFDLNGKQKTNLAIRTNELLKGGMCVNYDNGFDYRFFLVFSNRVVCYNEMGQVVRGWNFSSPKAPLSGAAFYTQINGIDFLTFKDVNSKIYLLNRRGENRFGPTASTKLPNESDFVIGKNEELVHKLGYANQYIYTRFLKDGYTDSLKLDLSVNAVSAKWVYASTPILLIEEPSRILLFNTSGYLEHEILKPQNANRFVEVDYNLTFRYVFFNNSNNSLYLLNKDGRLLVSGRTAKPTVFGLNETHFYTFDGLKINQQKIK